MNSKLAAPITIAKNAEKKDTLNRVCKIFVTVVIWIKNAKTK
jgi:hypothetical protein